MNKNINRCMRNAMEKAAYEVIIEAGLEKSYQDFLTEELRRTLPVNVQGKSEEFAALLTEGIFGKDVDNGK